ncbi:MarR family transcriptional regulator [Desulfofundulus thermobenzoicus]|uniref:MarR family transcriptional regulator n=1 Tax=Desulfofundulus thermobenzoicus TaxID=29376 RepID=A0A6N7IWP2_9FIRM|nr:MarR family transcriptional regulator [Desulfofundulus thermobenzoicus]MQL53907.1 MarR family transcriptional regulator [Desulfofundulus thermobenzoicus]HHW44859.1 MarR family transcriptional regulator [Desulfotomaculum sp.]
MQGEIRDIREVIREEMLMHDHIMDILKQGPQTIPEIAGALGRPSHEVMFWVMGMRKYGLIEETGEVTDEGYYRYGAAAKEDH